LSRVLVTGGAGAIGSAVVRRLLADPAYDVRVADRKEAPQWMREGCEVRQGDLRDLEHAGAAVRGCRCLIHLASPAETAPGGDYSLITASAALDSSLLRAAIDHRVEYLVYVSCAAALEAAQALSASEHPAPAGSQPLGALGFAKLLGERLCQAARVEHGLPYVICHLPALASIEKAADEIVAAMSSPAP
jgi:nucleoside-diphosphate-sugar epimerase